MVAKCLDCNGFLCQEGVDIHKKPLLKTHQVIKLEDIKSGKVNLQKLGSKKQPTCSKHKGQPLWFFCETCEILICRDCTVVNHQKPEHKYVELENVVSGHRKKLEELVEANEVIKAKVVKMIKETKETRNAIGVQMQQVNEEIDEVVEKIKAHIDLVCRAEKERLAKERAEYESQAEKELTSAEETLRKQEGTLQTALHMANQVLQSGSDYDIASVFKQISPVLETNRQIKPVVLSTRLTDPPLFLPNLEINKVMNIGSFRRKDPFSYFVLEGRLTEQGANDGPGKLSNVRGITTTVNGDIAIANNFTDNTPVKVYSIHGKFKFSLDQRSSSAYDVATSPDGQFLVTTEDSRMVKVFDPDGQYKNEFAVVSPEGVSSDTTSTSLKGITVNSSNNQVYIGAESNKKYISVHDLNGTHCKSIPLTISPRYLTTTSQGLIIVSPHTESQGVQILDSNGSHLYTIDAPEGVSKWHPVGVCSNSDDDIFVFSRGGPVGIYQFSSSGYYLGCINKGNKYNFWNGGLTFSLDDEKLFYADGGWDVYTFRRH